MRLCGDAAGCDLPQSKRGGCHAEIWFVGACCRSWPCRSRNDGWYCARRPHCAIGFESDRRSASPGANGNCPIQVGRPPLLLVSQRLARPGLVPVRLSFKTRPRLGWSGWLARLASPRPPAADCSSAAPPPGATDSAPASPPAKAASRPSAATRSAGTPPSTPGDGVTKLRGQRQRFIDTRSRLSRPACGR